MSGKGKPFGPYDDLNPVYEKWEKFLEENVDDAPSGLKS